MITINVSRDFTKYPSGRFKMHGDTSGQAFREKFLVPPLMRHEPICVELDGAIGYGSSFLEEAFGGVVRETHISSEEILRLIELKSEDKALLEEIKGYIRAAGH